MMTKTAYITTSTNVDFVFLFLTLFRMGLFGAAHGWGGKKASSSLKSVTQILQ